MVFTSAQAESKTPLIKSNGLKSDGGVDTVRLKNTETQTAHSSWMPVTTSYNQRLARENSAKCSVGFLMTGSCRHKTRLTCLLFRQLLLLLARQQRADYALPEGRLLFFFFDPRRRPSRDLLLFLLAMSRCAP